MAREGTLRVGEHEVSTLIVRPRTAVAVYVLAHGAGAGMHHAFMEGIAQALARESIATLRFQFPYTEAGKKRIDPAAILEATVEAAIARARKLRLPIVAGGKSMGARMTARLLARASHQDVRGLVFLGFPLHAADKADVARAEHLYALEVPMLFLQGSRDALAELRLLRPITKKIGARLHVIDEADHGFAVPKRSGRDQPHVLAELARITRAFVDEL